MDSQTAKLLTDFVMMVGLLRRDMKAPQNNTFERHEGRFVRIEQKFSELTELISQGDPELAKALHSAFQQPSRALAFKNAEHQKQLKGTKDKGPRTD
jgi:5-methylcytosine-specific restriction endonuclease McrBC GTP-binding regulatory subunit McrB